MRIEYGAYSNMGGYWFEVFDENDKLISTDHAEPGQVLFGSNGFLIDLRRTYHAYGKGSLIRRKMVDIG